VIPEYDKKPEVVSTDVFRARAMPKFPMFNDPPAEIETIWTAKH
jgi:hypothetical protein